MRTPEVTMKAAVGDRLVVVRSRLDQPTRDGKILEVRGDDGSPPYLVEWSDNGHRGLVFPGPDAHVQHFGEPGPEPAAATVRTWRIDLQLFELGGETDARAVLVSDIPPVEATGKAQRNPADPDIPWVGDEIAAARALHRLADRMLQTASAAGRACGRAPPVTAPRPRAQIRAQVCARPARATRTGQGACRTT
jgi:hypothetical protein